MNNVWENCTFSDEIISGDLKQHKFAVELHEFLSNTADPVYQDPTLFFQNTYLTNQMKSMLKDTLLRLDRNERSSSYSLLIQGLVVEKHILCYYCTIF